MRRTLLQRSIPILVLIIGLGVGYALGLHRLFSLEIFIASREALLQFVEEHSLLATSSFVIIYAAAVAIAFPAASIFTVAGGFLFGWLTGGILSIIGATIGATMIFLAARYAFGDLLRSRATGAIRRFAEEFHDDAFSYLLVLRLTPVLPFVAVNIAPAFFDVKTRIYVAATFLGIMPGAFVYAFLGSGLEQSLADIAVGGFALHDLLTPETSAALFGLAGLSVVGLVLKKVSLRRRQERRARCQGMT